MPVSAILLGADGGGHALMGELAAWIVAVSRGREGATAARPALIASGVAGWIRRRLPRARSFGPDRVQLVCVR
jgi:hypothetical protein